MACGFKGSPWHMSFFERRLVYREQRDPYRRNFPIIIYSKCPLGKYVIPWLHLLGGAMILVGLFTRLWCLLQIPVLIGAMLLVNVRHGFFAGESDLLFSIIVFVLLLFFFIEGGGPLSLDNFLRRSSNGKTTH